MERSSKRPRIGTAALACAVALLGATWSLSAFASWSVSKHPMGPGWVVTSSDPKIASFTAPNETSARAQADVLNKFEQKQAKRDGKGK